MFTAASVVLLAVVYLIFSTLRLSRAAVGDALLDIKTHNIAECVAIGLCLAAALFVPRSRVAFLLPLEQAVARFAARRIPAMLFVGLLPLVLRIALLPFIGIPQPLVADEFGYLLLADTLASGRLANPTHPFWKSLETVYVFHQPTYASIYPVAPAIPIAIAIMLRMHPWVGVWAAAGVMCALICWMLQGWLPPKWAFLGGLLAVGRFTIVSPWMNTYWGGAVAAAGGALVLGALPRLMKREILLDPRRSIRNPAIRNALLFALGLVILAQSRPFEATWFALPLIAMLGYWLLKQQSVPFRTRLTNVVLPVSLVMIALIAATLWYNSRTTGNPLLPPYLWHQRLYGTPQPLLWQGAIMDAPRAHRYQDIADVFRWQLDAHQQGFSWPGEGARLQDFWLFYLQPLLTFPLLLLPLVLRRRRLLVAFASAVALLAGNAMYSFFFAHYAAPLCGLMILMIVSGLRYLRVLRFHARPVGAVLFAGVIASIALSDAATAIGGTLQPVYISATYTARGQALRQLEAMGGKHLVLVRYSPEHKFDFGVVFNDADIDRSPVVWAHQVDSRTDQALARYYHDRSVWLFNPDETPVTLVPFSESPYIRTIAPAPGRRDDIQDGVSPGSIAVLLGANLTQDLHATATPGPLPGLPLRLLSVTQSLGSLFAPCESDDTCGGSALKTPFPFESAGLSVKFGQAKAPILAVSNLEGQESVTVQVPFEVPAGETSVTLRGNLGTFTRKVTILPASPGIFNVRMSDGAVRAIVLRSDGSRVDLQHPAHPGETLRMFATGLGPMQPPVQTNQPGSADSDATPVQRLVVGFHAHGIPLISARYAPGMVGVAEVTFQLPPDAATGPDMTLSLAVLLDGKPVYSNTTHLPVQ